MQIMKNSINNVIARFVVVGCATLLQFDIIPAIRSIIALVLVMIVIFNKASSVMAIILLLMPIADKTKVIGTATIPMILSVVFTVKELPRLFRELKMNKWIFVIVALLVYSSIVYLVNGTTGQLMITVKLFAYSTVVKVYIDDCVGAKKTYGEIFANVVRILGLGFIISFAKALLFDQAISSGQRLTFSDSTMVNSIGIQSAFAAISLILLKMLGFAKKTDLLLFLVVLAVLFLTMSRTAIMMILVAAVLFLIVELLKGKIIRTIIVIAVSVVGVMLLAIIPYTNNLFTSSIDRFEVEDLSNGRYEIWEKTSLELRNNKKYLLFGAGSYNKLEVTGRKNDTIMAHNFVLETIVIYGLVGMFVLILELVVFVKETFIRDMKVKKLLSKDIVSFIPFFALIGGFCYSHTFMGKPVFIIVAISLLPVVINRTMEKEINEE